MKRTCLKKNTIGNQWSEAKPNTDEQDSCEFSRNSGTGYPNENSFNEQPFNPKDIQNVKSYVQMKSRQFKRTTKFIVDAAMIIGLVGCAISTGVFEQSKKAAREGANINEVFHWGTSHCIISLLLVATIIIHIVQHWGYIKAVISRKLYLKNKLVTAVFFLFVLTVISISMYVAGFTFLNLHLHSMVTHLFVLVALIHLVMNLKKFIFLIREKKCREVIN